jgi:hypothetical protein
MIEALWSLEFISSQRIYGAGVVVLETDRLVGGDAQYFYIGRYKIESGIIEADVDVEHYAGQPFSIFGPSQRLKVILKGKVVYPVMELQGCLANNPKQTFTVRCTKRADLP